MQNTSTHPSPPTETRFLQSTVNFIPVTTSVNDRLIIKLMICKIMAKGVLVFLFISLPSTSYKNYYS